MRRMLASFLLASTVCAPPAHAAPDCLDTDAALAFWRPVREQAGTTALPADELAPDLVGCLGSTNPELRDTIGYELFTMWLREGRLGDDTRAALLVTLGSELRAAGPDAALGRSFAALVLAELMRSDARQAFMDDAARQSLLASAIDALAQETDFRGLDAEIGWVHPVAHLADLLWRFALHPSTTPSQAGAVLAAVRGKVAPAGVFYTFNEGDRLARVVAAIITRNLLPPAEVAAWLGGFSTPQSIAGWPDAFRSPAGMAELHDTKQFLRALADQLDGADVERDVADSLEALVRHFTALI